MKQPPQPSLDDIVFLLQQLDKIDHAQDHDAVAAIAKKYNVCTIRNHRGKIGRPR